MKTWSTQATAKDQTGYTGNCSGEEQEEQGTRLIHAPCHYNAPPWPTHVATRPHQRRRDRVGESPHAPPGDHPKKQRNRSQIRGDRNPNWTIPKNPTTTPLAGGEQRRSRFINHHKWACCYEIVTLFLSLWAIYYNHNFVVIMF